VVRAARENRRDVVAAAGELMMEALAGSESATGGAKDGGGAGEERRSGAASAPGGSKSTASTLPVPAEPPALRLSRTRSFTGTLGVHGRSTGPQQQQGAVPEDDEAERLGLAYASQLLRAAQQAQALGEAEEVLCVAAAEANEGMLEAASAAGVGMHCPEVVLSAFSKSGVTEARIMTQQGIVIPLEEEANVVLELVETVARAREAAEAAESARTRLAELRETGVSDVDERVLDLEGECIEAKRRAQEMRARVARSDPLGALQVRMAAAPQLLSASALALVAAQQQFHAAAARQLDKWLASNWSRVQVLEHASTEAPAAAAALSNWLESALLEAATLEASANGTMHSPIGGKTPSMSVVAARQAAEGTATHSTASESDSGAGTAQAPAQKGVSNAMAGDDTLARELDIGILRAELAAARCEIRSLEVRVRELTVPTAAATPAATQQSTLGHGAVRRSMSSLPSFAFDHAGESNMQNLQTPMLAKPMRTAEGKESASVASASVNTPQSVASTRSGVNSGREVYETASEGAIASTPPPPGTPYRTPPAAASASKTTVAPARTNAREPNDPDTAEATHRQAKDEGVRMAQAVRQLSLPTSVNLRGHRTTSPTPPPTSHESSRAAGDTGGGEQPDLAPIPKWRSLKEAEIGFDRMTATSTSFEADSTTSISEQSAPSSTATTTPQPRRTPTAAGQRVDGPLLSREQHQDLASGVRLDRDDMVALSLRRTRSASQRRLARLRLAESLEGTLLETSMQLQGLELAAEGVEGQAKHGGADMSRDVDTPPPIVDEPQSRSQRGGKTPYARGQFSLSASVSPASSRGKGGDASSPAVAIPSPPPHRPQASIANICASPPEVGSTAPVPSSGDPNEDDESFISSLFKLAGGRSKPDPSRNDIAAADALALLASSGLPRRTLADIWTLVCDRHVHSPGAQGSTPVTYALFRDAVVLVGFVQGGWPISDELLQIQASVTASDEWPRPAFDAVAGTTVAH